MSTMVILPVKSFATGKGRLSSVLDPETRDRLSRALADHVAATVAATGRTPLVVTGDTEVATWAEDCGYPMVGDPGGGLSAAAGAGATVAVKRPCPWLVLHSDLPWLTTSDVDAVARPLEKGQTVIAPSSDGGTSAIGSYGKFSFHFGPLSFHRHLVDLDDPLVVARPGLLVDIDSPADLLAATGSPRGAWLDEALLPPD